MYQQAKDLENDRFCQNALEVNQRSKNKEKKGMLNSHAKKMAEKIREETNFIEPADDIDAFEPFDHSLAMDYSDSMDSYRSKKHTNGFNSLNLARETHLLGWLPAGEYSMGDDGEQINRNASRVRMDDRSRRKKPRGSQAGRMEGKQAAVTIVAPHSSLRENYY
jgi:hypothetical protein